jgi:hypothetical protein
MTRDHPWLLPEFEFGYIGWGPPGRDWADLNIGPGFYVYYLWLRGQLVYIGSTIHLRVRIRDHNGRKDFDRVTYATASNGYAMRARERRDVERYRPPLNRRLPSPKYRPKSLPVS